MLRLINRIERYEADLKKIRSLIETVGYNNHLGGLESYFETKVDSLREQLKEYQNATKV